MKAAHLSPGTCIHVSREAGAAWEIEEENKCWVQTMSLQDAGLGNLGELLVQLDHLDEAEPMLKEALAAPRITLGNLHPGVGRNPQGRRVWRQSRH